MCLPLPLQVFHNSEIHYTFICCVCTVRWIVTWCDMTGSWIKFMIHFTDRSNFMPVNCSIQLTPYSGIHKIYQTKPWE